MKNFEIKKEIMIWVIMLLPMGYLYSVWSTLPDIVPTHFGVDGKPNDWSHKITLVYIIAGLLVGVYVLLTIIPAIDPKGKIKEMGNKYFLFKLFMMLFMSVISVLIIRSALTQNVGNINIVFVVLGALFMFLGNYMQTVRPNYFIGIRTPWTLESETVWRKTHQLGGKLYFAVGLLIMVLPFIVKQSFDAFFPGLIIVAAIIPVIYSYVLFRQEKNKQAS